jgi:hypothetical protein
MISGLSPATTTRGSVAPKALLATRCATRTTIGTPPMSAKGLLGKRVEASRAGISTVYFMLAAARAVRAG